MLSSAMVDSVMVDEAPDTTLRTSLVELTVGVQLAEPWAWVRQGIFGGIEVEDVQAFAKWLGRPVRFEILAPWEVARALAEAEVDLVIGGLQADPALRKVALSCRYSSRTFAAGDERHGERHPHVWATPRGSSSLFATLAFYLWMVRRGEPRLHAVTVH